MSSLARYFPIIKMYKGFIWRFKHSSSAPLLQGNYALLPLFTVSPDPEIIVGWNNQIISRKDLLLENGYFVKMRDLGDFTEEEVYDLNQLWNEWTSKRQIWYFSYWWE